MTETQTVYPSSELAGTWEQSNPVALDGTSYTEPRVIGAGFATYDQRDGMATGEQNGRLVLPQIANPPSDIVLVGTNSTGFVQSVRNPLDVPMPTEAIEAGDLIEIIIFNQEPASNDPGPPATPAGWNLRRSWYNNANYIPRATKYWKYAVGGEQGSTVAVTVGNFWVQGMARVWRGVNQTDPYDIAAGDTQAHHGVTGTAPNGLGVTAVTDGAVVTCDVLGNRTGGTPTANVAPFYTANINEGGTQERAFVCCHRKVGPGFENPNPYSWNVQNWTAVTDVLRPGGASVIVLIIAAASDNWTVDAPTPLASGDAGVSALNEIQRLTPDPGLGTFRLTFDGQQTAAIAPTATAGQVQAALETLANIGAGEVLVSGGPANQGYMDVEFLGSLAATNVPMLVADTGLMSIVEQQTGSAGHGFDLEQTLNTPQSQGAFAPQIHVWGQVVANYKPGRPLDLKVAGHDEVKSWVAAVLVLENNQVIDPGGLVAGDTGGAVEVWSAARTGLTQQAAFEPITPATSGSKIVTIAAKSRQNEADYYDGNQSSPPPSSAPSAYSSVVAAVADAMAMTVAISPPVDAVAQTPGPAGWDTGTEFWTTASFAVKPETPPTAAGDLAVAVATASEMEWIEIAGAAGNMYEVLELDLSSVPPAAVKLSASVEFAHQSSVRNTLRAVMVGINADGSISPCQEFQLGYQPLPLNTTVEVLTQPWSETADGTPIYQFDRLGIAFFSTSAHPEISTHRIFWARANIEYEAGGPVVANVVGPDAQSDPVTWEYSSTSGLPQISYQVMLISDSGQDPDLAATAVDPLAPSAGEIIADSGRVSSATARSHSFTDPIFRGPATAAVRSWTRLANGLTVASPWSTDDYDPSGIQSPTPGAPGSSFNAELGTVELTATVGAGVTRAWLYRSTDAGATWEKTKSSPITVSPGSVTVHDDRTPHNQMGLRYRLAVDAGPMTETSVAVDLDPVDVPGSGWYLMALGSPTKNMRIDVATLNVSTPRASVLSEQVGASVVASAATGGAEITLGIRTINKASRVKLGALLDHDGPLRIVSVLGQSWIVRPVTGESVEMLRAMPLPSETTGLRDAHISTTTFREVNG